MTRAQIRAAVNGHLTALGFGRGSWSWDGPLLTVIVGDYPMRIKIKANTPQYILVAEMYRMQGWAEASGMRPATKQPKQLNGAATHDEQLPLHV